jgi:hypothetical protein
MAEIQSTRSPLARLILLMVCPAVTGSILAGVHYYAVDLPEQNAVQVPSNGNGPLYGCSLCRYECTRTPPDDYCTACMSDFK